MLKRLQYTQRTRQSTLNKRKKSTAAGRACTAGRGRAGTMAIAYLIVEKGMAPGEAQKALSRVRPHVSPRLWKRATVREMYRRNKQRLLAKEMATHQQGLQQPVPLPQQLPPQKLFSG